MTDLIERTPVQDVLLDERKPEPTVEPPPREERGIEVPTAKRPVRWIRWMIAALLVTVVGATVLIFALSDDGTTAVLDTDGSYQAAETARMASLVPTGVEIEGSWQYAEDLRVARLAPTGVEIDGSWQYAEDLRVARLFQAAETRRTESLKPGPGP